MRLSDTRITYKDAGVDIEAGNSFVNMIKPLVKSTFRPEVMADIGGFGGLFSLNTIQIQESGACLRYRRCRNQAQDRLYG